MRGEVDFAASLRSRVQRARRASPSSAFARVLARIEPTPGVRELIDAVHERGGRVGVVSGGFHEILDTDRPRARRRRLAGEPPRRRRRRAVAGPSTARSWMPKARPTALREWAASRGRAAVADDRDRRRRERPADDGRRGPRPRLQRQAGRARPGGPDRRARRSARSDPAAALRSGAAHWPVSAAVGSVAGMDIILVPGLWLDASSWDDVTPASRRPVIPSTRSRCPASASRHPESSDIGIADWVAPSSTRSTRATGPSCSSATAAAATSSRAPPMRGPSASRASSSSTPFPPGDGGSIWEFPVVDGVIPFPGWDSFEEPEVADLDADTRAARGRAHAVGARAGSDRPAAPQRRAPPRRAGRRMLTGTVPAAEIEGIIAAAPDWAAELAALERPRDRRARHRALAAVLDARRAREPRSSRRSTRPASLRAGRFAARQCPMPRPPSTGMTAPEM